LGDGFRFICYAGNLSVVRWFVEAFKLTADHARMCRCCSIEWTYREGHLEQLKWMIDYFKLTADDIYCRRHGIINAINNCRLEAVKWIFDKFGPRYLEQLDDSFHIVCSIHKNLEMAKFLYSVRGMKFSNIQRITVCSILNYGTPEMKKWLRQIRRSENVD